MWRLWVDNVGGKDAKQRASGIGLRGRCEPHEVQQFQVPDCVVGSWKSQKWAQNGWEKKTFKTALQRRTEGFLWVKSWTWASHGHSQPGKPSVPWGYIQSTTGSNWGREFCPSAQPSWDPSWGIVLSSDFFPAEETCETVRAGLMEGHEFGERDRTHLWEAEGVEVVQPGKRRCWGNVELLRSSQKTK